ncbi:MAG: hypothetical protein H7Y00_06120 [Fimbriimonadaceae bacterium]|nr:hypothetical protein [Chitinophagales bacterium]
MRLLLIVLLFSTNVFSQSLTEKEINAYVTTIDSLRENNTLIKYWYPQIHYCGGSVYGYYLNDTLVYIESKYSAELGYTEETVYLFNDIYYKVIFYAHQAEWGKYKNDPDFDESKMTYTDTTYTIIFSEKIIFKKYSGNKLLSETADSELITDLLNCGQMMKEFLDKEKINAE